MEIKDAVMEAIEENLIEGMCDGCPHWGVIFAATLYEPEEQGCPGDGSPFEPGCKKHEQYRQIEKLAEKFQDDVMEIINSWTWRTQDDQPVQYQRC